jgi:hypothetical protein
MLRGSVAILACLLGCAALTGCSPAATPAPSPTSTAIFASEDEALAAATAVYQQYTAAFDVRSAKGGIPYDALSTYVTPEYLQKLNEPGLLEKNEWHTDGSTTFDTISVVETSESDRSAVLRVRLCRDVSGIRILDSQGEDVTPTTRLKRFPVEVEMVSSAPSAKMLVISDSGSWTGKDFC